jgi:phosphatidylserine/phosphatidylglycerophosphate/cardiolipin synthase-like enzyme
LELQNLIKSTAIIGSANIDLRNLLLNYEVAMLTYLHPDVETVAQWVGSLMQDCHIGTTDALFRRRPLPVMLWSLAPPG